ncbi:MAG: hypothetical protein ABDH21_02050 [bacterium]
MFSVKNNFIVMIRNLNKEGEIIDAITKEKVIIIKNRFARNIGSSIINMVSFSLLGGAEWDFIHQSNVIFKLKKSTFNSLVLAYNFNDNFYNVWKIRTIGTLSKFFGNIVFESINGKLLQLKRRGLLHYSLVDSVDEIYCSVTKEIRGLVEEQYYLTVHKFLESEQNYVFLVLPVIISVYF